MSDAAIVDAIAREWLRLGGDADGLRFLWRKVVDRLEEIKWSESSSDTGAKR
jgi:hypothetical protein